MIAAVTMAFQNAATTGEGLTQFLPQPRTVTFRVTGNGSVSAGAVTIECCPSMTPAPLPGSGSGAGSGTTWTEPAVSRRELLRILRVFRSAHRKRGPEIQSNPLIKNQSRLRPVQAAANRAQGRECRAVS